MRAKVEPEFASLPLLECLSTRELRQVRSMTTLVPVHAGRTLMRRGTPGRELIVLLEGGLDVHRNGRVIAHESSGSFVGEISLLLHALHTATVVTSEDSLLGVIGQADLRDLLHQSPALFEPLLDAAASHLAGHAMSSNAVDPPEVRHGPPASLEPGHVQAVL